eukprot:5304818-Amphidinium_carterae.2
MPSSSNGQSMGSYWSMTNQIADALIQPAPRLTPSWGVRKLNTACCHVMTFAGPVSLPGSGGSSQRHLSKRDLTSTIRVSRDFAPLLAHNPTVHLQLKVETHKTPARKAKLRNFISQARKETQAKTITSPS